VEPDPQVEVCGAGRVRVGLGPVNGAVAVVRQVESDRPPPLAPPREVDELAATKVATVKTATGR